MAHCEPQSQLHKWRRSGLQARPRSSAPDGVTGQTTGKSRKAAGLIFEAGGFFVEVTMTRQDLNHQIKKLIPGKNGTIKGSAQLLTTQRRQGCRGITYLIKGN